jgi:RNA polymerase sigma-70 factor (ECF subfamily)
MASSDPVEAMDVSSLTRGMVAGDETAWTTMHRIFAPRLWRYLLVAARGDEEIANECLQQTFVRAVRHARRFDSGEALWSWLTLIARQVLSDTRRAAGRRRTFLEWFASHLSLGIIGNHNSISTSSGAGIVDGGTGPHAAAAFVSETDSDPDPLPVVLEIAWPFLSEEDRWLLEQKYLDGGSVRQLAEAAGTSEKTIESRLTRARRRLRDLMLRHLKKSP